MSPRHFRAGVVTVVERANGEVLAFERADAPGSWQLPQGGIEVGEDPLDAAWRELKEETGLSDADVDLVAEHPTWTVYEWPREVSAGRKGLGQAHRWFTFRVKGDDVEPMPDGSEFVDWRWVSRDWLIDQVIQFRTEVYRSVLGNRRP